MSSDLAIVMSGGGARAAYQVGCLRFLAKSYPDLSIDIVTGVSAGAVNAAFLACSSGNLEDRAQNLNSGANFVLMMCLTLARLISQNVFCIGDLGFYLAAAKESHSLPKVSLKLILSGNYSQAPLTQRMVC